MSSRFTNVIRSVGPRLVEGALAAAVVAVPAGLLLALIRTKWGPMRHLDVGTAERMARTMASHPGLLRFFEDVAVWLAPNTFYVIDALLVIGLLVRRSYRLAIWVGVTAATGSLLGVLLKHIVSRSRPELLQPVAHAPGYSFPSGHALNSFLGAAILLLVFLPVLRGAWRAVAWVVAVLVTLLTGVDRVALGVHYVTDVLGGWGVAAATLAGTTAGFQMWRREHGRRHVAPAKEGLEPEAAAGMSRTDQRRG